jgi:DNA-binding NtrC family response regulator
MPGLDGFQVLDKLKEKHDHLEVIILTAHGSVESAFTTSKHGAYDFMTKPYDFDELIIKIRQAYEKRLKKKHANNKELFELILSLSTNIPLGAESSLDLLEQLKEYDDHEK